MVHVKRETNILRENKNLSSRSLYLFDENSNFLSLSYLENGSKTSKKLQSTQLIELFTKKGF